MGGDAARLLSELTINTVDRRLIYEGVDFCRFVDDYRIFADSEDSAHKRWVSLADQLLRLEGLQLQKGKTLIEPSDEFVKRTEAIIGVSASGSTAAETDVSRFMSLRIHYDPYSPTAESDYEALKESLANHDVTGMLAVRR